VTRAGVASDHGVDAPGKTERPQQRVGESPMFVRNHRDAKARVVQGPQRVRRTGIRLRRGGTRFVERAIVVKEALQHGAFSRLIGRAALRGRGAADQDQRTAADHAAQLPPELGGPKGPEPTRYGDWEIKGIVSDF